jgi:formamidopyrimidine-DNA glycosylase
MPELPDLTIYLEHLDRLLEGQRLLRLSLLNPFVLRSVAPKPAAFEGKRFVRSARIGKRIALSFEDDLHAVMHLMVACHPERNRRRGSRSRPSASRSAPWLSPKRAASVVRHCT